MSLYQQARAVVALAKSRLRVASDYHTVWNSPDGQRVLIDIMRAGGLLTVARDGEPGGTDFNDGKRAVALHVVERLRWSEAELVALARQGTGEQLQDED